MFLQAEMDSLLTYKEKEVLNKLLQGKLNKEISNELGISINTTKKYVGKIFKKTTTNCRTQLVAKLIIQRA